MRRFGAQTRRAALLRPNGACLEPLPPVPGTGGSPSGHGCRPGSTRPIRSRLPPRGAAARSHGTTALVSAELVGSA